MFTITQKKQTKGKHKKFYEGVFDVSDIRETAYLIVTEIFYAVPDSNNCIAIDGYKVRFQLLMRIRFYKIYHIFSDRICNGRGALTYMDISEHAKVTNVNNETEEISLFDWQPPNKLRQTVDGKVALRRECAEVLRLFQDNMIEVFSLFNAEFSWCKGIDKNNT